VVVHCACRQQGGDGNLLRIHVGGDRPGGGGEGVKGGEGQGLVLKAHTGA
jgi:hypothetical protein